MSLKSLLWFIFLKYNGKISINEKVTRIGKYLRITYQAVEQHIESIYRNWSIKKSFF